MKKRNIFAIGCLTAMLGLGAFAGVSSLKEKPVEKAEATSIDYTYHFTNNGNWSSVYIYLWKETGGHSEIGWKSTTMDWDFNNSKGEGVYTKTLSLEWVPENVIFHNGDGTQSEDIVIGSDDSWYWKNDGQKVGTWSYSPSTVSIAGTFNSWNTTAEGWGLTLNNGVWSLTKNILAGETFKFVANNDSWMGYGAGQTSNDNALGKTRTDCFVSSTGENDGDYLCLKTGSYTFKAKNGFTHYENATYGIQIVTNSTSTYSLFADNVELEDEMSTDSGGMVATVAVTRGNVISIKKDGVLLDDVTPNDGVGNNLNSEMKIIVTGTHRFYFSPTNGKLWVDGYENLHKFIAGYSTEYFTQDGFIADTIDGSECKNPTTIDRNGMTVEHSDDSVWKYYSDLFYQFNDNEKSAFQSAVTYAKTKGLPLSNSDREDELVEAAERYIWLMEKWNGQGIWAYGNSSGTISSAIDRNVVPNTNSSSAVIAAFVSIAAIATGMGFVLLKKKKEI